MLTDPQDKDKRYSGPIHPPTSRRKLLSTQTFSLLPALRQQASLLRQAENDAVGQDLFTSAYAYLDSGLSLLPIRPDGSKAPAIAEWKPFQSQPPTAAEVEAWLAHGYGLG